MLCPSCGADSPENARFCPSCGHGLAGEADQRRLATVLFADLVGFTALSETTDPEQVKNLVDRCMARLADDVIDFGGHVDKVVGDALVALFGAPVAHEDDAERAVRAALRLHETIEEVAAEAGSHLALRVGVNTGEVLVGALRAGGDYTAMGDVVNTASRLQTHARPGEVLVGTRTYAASRRSIRFEPMGELAVKGREENVEAWRAVSAIVRPGRNRPGARTGLVGRDTEMTLLRTSLDVAVRRRRALAVLIAGEAGVGKSRLVAELAGYAESAHGARVLRGHCLPYGETNAWGPVSEALRQALALPDDGVPPRSDMAPAIGAVVGRDPESPEVARLVTAALSVLGRDDTDSEVDPARVRDEGRRVVRVVFEALSRERPLMISFADVQWAEDLVLEVGSHLLNRMGDLPFVFVATTRSDPVPTWTAPAGRFNSLRITVDPLTPEDSEELALRLLGPDASPAVLAGIRDRSGGNPFFIEELVSVMEDASAGPTSDGAVPELPTTVHALLAARLDTLPAPERRALEDAAVVGPAGPIALVDALAHSRPAAATDADARRSLALLAARELVTVGGDEFSFRNSLIRDVAYGTLTKAERARRHGFLARHIALDAERDGRVDEVLDLLGYHFITATSLDAELDGATALPDNFTVTAIGYLERAAAHAATQERWPQARQYLAQALKIVPADGDEVRLRLLIAQARAEGESRDTQAARFDLDAARRIARRIDAPRSELEIDTLLGDVLTKEGDWNGAATVLERAVEAWRAFDDPIGLAGALRNHGMLAVYRTDAAEAETSIREALALYRRAGDRRGEAWALQNLAWIPFFEGRHEEAERRLEAAAEAFGELGDWGGLGWSLGLLAWVRFAQGRLDEAMRLAEQIQTEASELGDRWAEAMMKLLLGNLAMWRGEVREGGRRAQQAFDVCRELGDGWGQLQACAPIACAANLMEDLPSLQRAFTALDAAAQGIRGAGHRLSASLIQSSMAVQRGAADALDRCEAVQPLNENPTFGGVQEGLLNHGLALLQAGRPEDALLWVDRAVTSVPDEPLGSGVAAGIARVLVLAALGRLDEAASLADELRDAPITFMDRFRLALSRAFVAERAGSPAEADRALAEAHATVDSTDAVLCHRLVRLADALLRDVRTGGDGFGDAVLADGRVAPGWLRAYRCALGLPDRPVPASA